MAEQLRWALQPPLFFLLLPLHDHGLHLQQHQRLGHVLGGLCCHWGEVPGWSKVWDAFYGQGEKGALHFWSCQMQLGWVGQEITVSNWQPVFHPIENETACQGETAGDSQSGGVPAPHLFKSETGQSMVEDLPAFLIGMNLGHWL